MSEYKINSSKSLKKVQDTLKTKVMRLNYKETKLVKFIRDISSESLLEELRNVFNELERGNKNENKNRNSYSNLKNLIPILVDRKILDLDTLINTNFISREEANYLIKSIRENKNIIITGNINSGKTTLLNSLLKYQKDARILVSEQIEELELSENILTCENPSSLNMKDIAMLNQCKNSRLVIGEIQNCNDGLGLLSALNIGSSVLGTFYSQENWRKDFLNLFDGNMREYAENMLNKNKFIRINVCRKGKDNKRMVDKIEKYD